MPLWFQGVTFWPDTYRDSLCEKMEMVSKKRIFGYDALKALAAFFVVLYHVGMVDFGYQEGVYYYPTTSQVLWLFCACGVPLFFMVNGALTVSRNYDLKKSLTKAGRLIVAGIFWALVIMCLKAMSNHDLSEFSISALGFYWFLFSLALMYLINHMLSYLHKWCRWALVAALLIYPFAANLGWDLVILHNPETTLPCWRTGLFTLYGVVYLYMGDYLKDYQGKTWMAIALALAGLSLLVIEVIATVNVTHFQFEGGNYCFPTFGALFLSMALFLFIKDYDTSVNWFKRFLSFLANNALGIYIFHLVLMIVLGWIFPVLNELTVHPVLAIMIAILYTIASAALSEAIRHTPLAFLLKL